jgi:D-cysteine desulfhydrase family pyridoxal phosphate-dependent enzyme
VLRIEEFPRIRLANLPTPLSEAPRLSAALGGPRILIKRDDLTGLAMGGNKSRKLEFVLADAQSRGADVLITTGSSQSNFAMQMAAAGRKLGMDVILVLFKGQHPEVQGNLLLDKILDAEVRIMDVTLADLNKIYEEMDHLADELRKKGRNPYIIPAGADTPLGTIGYIIAAQEISQQIYQLGITADYLFVASAFGGTQGGLALGAKYYKIPFKVIGSSVAHTKEECQRMFAELCNNSAKMLEMDVTINPDELTVYDDYVGAGYGIPTRACIEAIKLVSKTEGIFLDPVYTGKAMAALVDLIHKGKFTSNDTIIFIHTGGLPALFSYHMELMV